MDAKRIGLSCKLNKVTQMKPLELVDQMLNRTPFSCTEKQMRFLRDLIMQNSNTELIKQADYLHQKKLISAMKREVTNAKKIYEAAVINLKKAESSLKDAENGE